MALAQVFEDPFTEASDTDVEDHTPNTQGLGWTAIVGNGGTNAKIDAASDSVVAISSGLDYYAISVTEAQDDGQKSQFVLGDNTLGNQYCCVQLQDGSTLPDGYRFKYSVGPKKLKLQRIDNGSLTALGTDVGMTLSGGEVVELEIDASGNLTLRIDSVDKHSATDTNHIGGLAGFGIQQTVSAVGIDDFKAWLDVAAGGAISGSASITVTPGGNLSGQGKLSGAATATLTPTGTLKGSGSLSGAATATLTPTGTLRGAGSLSGATTATLTPSGTLTGLGALSGSTTIVLTPSGNLVGLGGGALSGAIALSLTPTGTLKGLGGLSGAASITVTVSGTLKAPGVLAGAASLTLTPTGTLRGRGALAGQATITFMVTGSLVAPVSGAISGVATFTLTPTGTLEGRGALLPATVTVAPPVNPLLFTESIVDQQGRPTRYFLRQWLSQRGVNTSIETSIDELNVLMTQVASIRGIRLLAGVGLTGGGDLSGPDRTFNLADTAVTPGDYTNTDLTVDAQGRITLAASGAGGGGGGDPYGIAPVVPLVANFTLINAGSATFIDTTFGIFMRVPTGGGSNIRFLNPVTALPATPWTMATRMRLVHPETTLTRVTPSLVLRNSGTGRIIIFGDHGTGYLVQRWSGFGAFNSSIVTLTTGYRMSDVPWKRIVNDGTDLSFEVSPDGESWAVLATEPLATYVSSVDQAGAGTWSNNIETSIILQSFVLA